jgi:hypothetical protein
MVVANPLFVGRWTAKKFKATVVNDIWPEVLFFTLVATRVFAVITSVGTQYLTTTLVVTLVSNKTSADLGVSGQLLTVLGTVSLNSGLRCFPGPRMLRILSLFRCLVWLYLSALPQRTNGKTFHFSNFYHLSCRGRYSDGRKMWSTIGLASRSLAQIVSS